MGPGADECRSFSRSNSLFGGDAPSTQLDVCDFLPLLYIVAPILVPKGVYVLRNWDLKAGPCGHPPFSPPASLLSGVGLVSSISSEIS